MTYNKTIWVNNTNPAISAENLNKIENELESLEYQINNFYPVGSYYETSDVTFDPNTVWGGTWELREGRQVLTSSNSVTVAAAQSYTLTSLTLQPNTEYLVLARVGSNQGGTLTIGCFLSHSGAASWFGGDARTTTSSGQGVVNWRYAKTGNSTATVTLTCYGYYTTSHIEYGDLLAIPLYNAGHNIWHRIA